MSTVVYFLVGAIMLFLLIFGLPGIMNRIKKCDLMGAEYSIVHAKCYQGNKEVKVKL